MYALDRTLNLSTGRAAFTLRLPRGDEFMVDAWSGFRKHFVVLPLIPAADLVAWSPTLHMNI